MERISIALPEECRAALTALARHTDLTVAEVVQQALDRELSRHLRRLCDPAEDAGDAEPGARDTRREAG